MIEYFKTKTSINIQIGMHIHQDLRVTWHNIWENRSKVKVTRAHNVYC